MSKSTIELELTKAAKVKRKKADDDQKHFAAIVRAVGKADEAVWDALSEAAQGWYNAAVESMEAKSDIEGFPETEGDTPADDDETPQPENAGEAEKPEPKPAAGGKRGGGKAFRTKLIEDPSKGLQKCFEETAAEGYKITKGTAEIIFYETKSVIAVLDELGLLKKSISL